MIVSKPTTQTQNIHTYTITWQNSNVESMRQLVVSIVSWSYFLCAHIFFDITNGALHNKVEDGSKEGGMVLRTELLEVSQLPMCSGEFKNNISAESDERSLCDKIKYTT